MKNKKWIWFIELAVLIALLVNIVMRWKVTNVSVGDFFCLELLAMLFWYEYDRIKNKLTK